MLAHSSPPSTAQVEPSEFTWLILHCSQNWGLISVHTLSSLLLLRCQACNNRRTPFGCYTEPYVLYTLLNNSWRTIFFFLCAGLGNTKLFTVIVINYVTICFSEHIMDITFHHSAALADECITSKSHALILSQKTHATVACLTGLSVYWKKGERQLIKR